MENGAAKVDAAGGDSSLVKSERLKHFLTCVDGFNKKITEECKVTVAELFGPLFIENPHYLERIQKVCSDSYLLKMDRKVNKFIETNELAQKLKELEDIADTPVEGVEQHVKAWRPTGLSAIQQLVAHDTEVKVKVNEKLREELKKEEAELEEMMNKAQEARLKYAEVKVKVATLKLKSEELLDQAEADEKTMMKETMD